MLKGAERLIFNGKYNPNPDGKFRDIDVPTVDVEFDLVKQLTFCKSTIQNNRPCRRVDLLGVNPPQ